MNITKITKDNALSFTDLSEESLAEADTLVGVGCVDDNGDPIGAALVDSDGERLLISSIRVNEDSRRKGAGSLLLDGIEEMAAAAGLDSVDAYFTEPEAEDFYLSNGYLVLQSYPVYQISYMDFIRAKEVRTAASKYQNCVKLKDLRPQVRRGLTALLNKLGFVSKLSQYDQNLSFVLVKPDDHPVAFVLVSYREDDLCLVIENLINTETDNPANIMQLLMSMAAEIKSEIPPESTIRFIATEDKIRAFTEKAMGGPEKLKETGSLLHAVKALK